MIIALRRKHATLLSVYQNTESPTFQANQQESAVVLHRCLALAEKFGLFGSEGCSLYHVELHPTTITFFYHLKVNALATIKRRLTQLTVK